MNTKTQNRQFVVIGGVAAGISAASAVKHYDPSIEVTVLEKGEFISYSPSFLPYYIADVMQDHRQLIKFTPEQAKQDYHIDAKIRHKAMAIYPAQNSVMVLDRESGEEKTIAYDALMIATGGAPISPPVPGIDLPNIFHVRTLTDGLKLKQYIADHAPKKVSIIGGGYIGMEMADACGILGMEVTILEKFGNIMGTMGDDITGLIEQHLEDHQVRLVKNITIDAFEAVEGKCGYVMTDGEKQRFETELVILAAGVRPEVALARGAGIEIGNTGAIAVNEYAQTSVENIYAAGDCTEVVDLVSGEKTYVPLAITAIKQGRTAGKNLVSPGCCSFKGSLRTMLTKIFDLEVARTGLSCMDAKRLGFHAVTSTSTADSRVSTYPGNEKITTTLIMDKTSKRLLGAEMAGKEGVSKRIDIFATAIHNQMSVQAISQLDLSYTPPYAPLWDPILVAANTGQKRVS